MGSRFTSRIVNSGELTELINSYLKEGATSESNQFTLLSYTGEYRPSKNPYCAFYLDGEHAFMLFHGDPSDGVGVCGGFTLIGEEDLQKRYHVFEKSGKTGKLLLINQLQGRWTYNNEVGAVFSRFRWERLLVTLICSWAKNAGLHQVFLLPAAKNPWATVSSNGHGTAYLRYDVTAQRLGFKRERDDQLYCLNLDQDLIDLYISFFDKNQ